MPPINLHGAGAFLDRLLRPDRAARNAQQAAADATRTIEARRRVELDIADLATAQRVKNNPPARKFG